MKIAFFTLLSPLKSALADYGEGLALGMAGVPGVTVDLFINDDYQPDNPIITEQFNIFTYHQFATRAHDYDAYFYSMGDHFNYNGYMLPFILRYPGVVLLHDLTLHRCMMHATLGQGDVQGYLDELHYAGAPRSLRLGQQIELNFGDHLMLDYPLFERVVDHSRGIVVHNHYARERILASRPQATVRRIPHAFFMPPGFNEIEPDVARTAQRAALKIDPDAFVAGSFGIFVPNKHLAACLTAFARVAENRPSARYILGGAPADGYDLEAEIARLGLTEQVHVTGWLPPPNFARQMLALDVGIHLRHPHIGGTPYTPIRLLGLGIATIVSDIEPLVELPSGACAKIAPDDYAEATLSAVLQKLAADREFLRLMQTNGRHFIQQRHDITDIARQYVRFIESIS